MKRSRSNSAWRDDPARLRALAASGLPGNGPEPAFDDIALLAAQVCEAPVAFFSVMGSERQWLKAEIGISIGETPAEAAICLHAMQNRGLFTIEDLSQDPRTAAHSCVTGPLSLRFYAAVRIHAPDQQPLGTLCVMDHDARPAGLTGPQSVGLAALARQVETQIALRQSSAELERIAQEHSNRKPFEFEALAENVSQLAWMAEPNGSVYWFNQRWFAYTGLDPTTAEGMDWRRVLRPGDVDAIEREVERHWAAGVAWERVYHLRSASGVFQPFLTRVEPVRDAAGAVIRWFGTGTDISAQVNAEQRLRELNDTLEQRIADALAQQTKTEEMLRQAHKMEALGQLTGGIAHDFNNLLTGVSGNLELLDRRLAQGRTQDLERYVNAAQDAARRAAALTQRLLAFSRRETVSPRQTILDELVFGMDDMIRRTLGPSIRLDIVSPAGVWPTLVDPNQAENALLNLCINALYAMPDGGVLTIAIENLALQIPGATALDLPPGQYVSLSVRDTGTGMAPEVIARAFDPFFTTKPIGIGTGLGLSMVYGFARQSHGQTRIASTIGQGTTVSIYLPRQCTEAPCTEPEPRSAPVRELVEPA